MSSVACGTSESLLTSSLLSLVVRRWRVFEWHGGPADSRRGSEPGVLFLHADITLGIALGSATQIALFVVPVTVLVAWAMGIEMDLNFNLLETACLALSILVTSFTLQLGKVSSSPIKTCSIYESIQKLNRENNNIRTVKNAVVKRVVVIGKCQTS
ncbi:hypothetical protein YC2023_121099 [Brassica napus]